MSGASVTTEPNINIQTCAAQLMRCCIQWINHPEKRKMFVNELQSLSPESYEKSQQILPIISSMLQSIQDISSDSSDDEFFVGLHLQTRGLDRDELEDLHLQSSSSMMLNTSPEEMFRHSYFLAMQHWDSNAKDAVRILQHDLHMLTDESSEQMSKLQALCVMLRKANVEPYIPSVDVSPMVTQQRERDYRKPDISPVWLFNREPHTVPGFTLPDSSTVSFGGAAGHLSAFQSTQYEHSSNTVLGFSQHLRQRRPRVDSLAMSVVDSEADLSDSQVAPYENSPSTAGESSPNTNPFGTGSAFARPKRQRTPIDRFTPGS